jgi:hypothetical protein
MLSGGKDALAMVADENSRRFVVLLIASPCIFAMPSHGPLHYILVRFTSLRRWATLTA